MRRVVFVLLASLIVGLSTAGPAHGYWSLFHSPHHLPHARPHHFHHQGAAGPVQPITPGQVIGAIQLGQQLLGPFLHQNQNQNQNQQPAPEPRVSAATTAEIDQTGKAVNDAVDNVNNLLKLVRTNDSRLKDTLKDVPKTAAGTSGVNPPTGTSVVAPPTSGTGGTTGGTGMGSGVTPPKM